MMIRNLIYCLVPIGILLVCISLASILGYLILLVIGDVLPLDKIVSKGTQLFLVLSIFPLQRMLDLSWEDIGFNGKSNLYRQFQQGLALGLATLGPIIILLYVLDIRIIDDTKIWTTGLILKTFLVSLFGALLISLIEEPIFRGVLLIGLQRKSGLLIAIVISACYYASLHFMKTDIEIPYQDLTVLSGFELAFDAFGNLLKPDRFSAFLALVVVGVFLGVSRLTAGYGLGFCIGCHTAWVFLIKATKSMSHLNTTGEYFFLASSYDGVIGFLVTGWLSLLVVGYVVYTKQRRV